MVTKIKQIFKQAVLRFWSLRVPLIEKMVNSAASSARSISASSKISTGDFPPSSMEYFFRPAFFMMLRPVAVPPVKETARTS